MFRRHVASLQGHVWTVVILLTWLVWSACGLEQYPINWASVRTASTAASAKNLTSNCICDLTAFSCDVDCCCDADCAAPVVASTTAAGRCLPSGPPNETLSYCLPKSSVSRVNLPSSGDFYDVTIQAAENRFFDKLLCITSSSDPQLGDSYPDPPAGAVDNNAADAACPQASAAPAVPSTYLYGTPVYVSQGGVTIPLAVPFPALSLECNDQYLVGFLANIPADPVDTTATCVRTLVNSAGASQLPTWCGSGSVNALALASITGLSFLSSPTAAAATAVNVRSIQRQDPSTGVFTTLATSVATSYASSTCINAIRTLRLVIYYNWVAGATQAATDGQGTISQIDVSVVVTDIPSTTTSFSQAVRVDWIDFRTGDTRVVQDLSGSPGYQVGHPLLAGTLVTIGSAASAQNAVNRYVEGLPLPAPGSDGTCSAVSSTPVRFGLNTTATCNVPLTVAALATFCNGQVSNAQYQLQQLLPEVLPAVLNSTLQVGIWGNSNFSEVAEWVQVQVANYPFSNLVYSSASRSCANVVVGWDLQILTGVAFSTTNLQNKALYANLCFKTATWDIPDNWPSAQAYSFKMTSTVTFISKAQTVTTGVRRPAPPLITPLPEDIFFPFLTSAGPSRVPPSLLLVWVALVLALAIVVWAG